MGIVLEREQNIVGKAKQEHRICSAVGCLTEDKKSKLKKGHNSVKNAFSIISLDNMDCFWIVNTFFEFQVNIFSDNRDITKCQKILKSKKGHNSKKTRCVCETRMPPKHPSFEKHDPDI